MTESTPQAPTIAELSAMVATLAQNLADLAGIVYASSVEETGPPAFIETLHRIADNAAQIQTALRSDGEDRA